MSEDKCKHVVFSGERTLYGMDAIAYAEKHGLTIAEHADPTEGSRDCLTADEARAVAREDENLVFVKVPADMYLPQIELLAGEAWKAGDYDLAEDCADALNGDDDAACRCMDAICEAIQSANQGGEQ